MVSSTFSLGGDPSSIRASAQQWNSFGEAAGTASSDIKGLNSEEFEGDEADDFRSKMNDSLPPNLDRTAEAWKQIGAALKVYADKLETYQQQLSGLKTQHDNQQQVVQNAQSSVSAAQSADTQEKNRVTTATTALKPGEQLPPSTYHSASGGAQSHLTEAQTSLQQTTDAANKVQSDHRVAVTACCTDIDDAKGKRFEKPPGFWGRLKNSVVDWVADHADILKKISGVLKVISAIAGVLSFIPILAPITGPIALVTGGAALAIDVTVKLATGEGSWLGIGIDAASMLLPGVGKLLKPAIMGTKVGRVVNTVAGKAVYGLKNKATITAGKYAAGLRNVARSKVSVRILAPRLAMPGVPGGMMQMSKNVPAVVNPRAAAAAFRRGADDHIPRIKISRARHPETADHVADAQAGRNWAGEQRAVGNSTKQPDVVVKQAKGAQTRRNQATGPYKKVVENRKERGIDLDEYPPAMFAEGGSGASVKAIGASDNRSAGSVMGWDVRTAGVRDGQAVRLVVVP